MRKEGMKRKKMASQGSLKKPFRFFKIILPAVLDQNMLRIPEKFSENFSNQISADANATLTVPTGVAWKVLVVNKDNKLYFGQGWAQFMEHNLIRYGYFLEFEYLGDRDFQVCIFDLSCCEIDYPRRNNHTFPREDDYDDDDQPIAEQPGPVEGMEGLKPIIDSVGRVTDCEASFTIQVRACHISSANYLHIPISFVEQYMRGYFHEFVKLQVQDRREWCVHCYRSKNDLRLNGPEWRSFTTENHWRLGEMYSFSIAKDEHDCLVFKVVQLQT